MTLEKNQSVKSYFPSKNRSNLHLTVLTVKVPKLNSDFKVKLVFILPVTMIPKLS